MNPDLLDPQLVYIGRLKSKIDKLERTIDNFKKYDNERKEYYRKSLVRLGQLESELDELNEQGLDKLKQRICNQKKEIQGLRAKLSLGDINIPEDFTLDRAAALLKTAQETKANLRKRIKGYKSSISDLINQLNIIRTQNEELKSQLSKHIIEVEIGDVCRDGHGLFDTFIFESNYSSDEINQAYYKATDLLGFDYLKECCKDYQDGIIIPKYASILVDRGIINKEDLIKETKGRFIKGGYEIQETSEFLDIYIDIVKLILADLDYNSFKTEYLDLDNAGYGLLSL